MRGIRCGATVLLSALLLTACAGRESGTGAVGAQSSATSSATAPKPVSSTPAPSAQPPPSTTAAPPAQPDVVAVDFTDAQTGWALANCGPAAAPSAECSIVATNDGGKTWGVEYRTNLPLAHLQFPSATVGFATGGPAVVATTDGGASWGVRRSSPRVVPQAVSTSTPRGVVPQGAPVPQAAFTSAPGDALGSVDFLTAQAGWATAATGLGRTTDGGATWAPVAVPGQCTLGSVDFPTAVAGWAGGYGAGGPCLLRTTDAGKTWTLVFDSAAAAALRPGLGDWEHANSVTAPQTVATNMRGSCPVDVHFTSADVGWLTLRCGGYYSGALIVLRTADAGRSWHYAWGVDGCLMGCDGMTRGYVPLFFLAGATAWRFGQGPTVQRTMDGGRTWSGGGPDCGTLQCNAVFFLDAVHGWMAAGAGLFATSDGGATWAREWAGERIP